MKLGIIDTEGKAYLSNNERFADVFNYLIYGGERVIEADKLKELDTTQIAIPYGNKARIPVQKYRDVLRLWNAMMDDNAIYVIMGVEIQAKVHYAMPVKDGLYDMIGYSRQIEEARYSYRENNSVKSENDSSDNTTEGNLFVDEGTLKIKLTNEEFLSGFRKEDKLIPIITAVVYLGSDPWDGPKSLFEMLDVKDERIYAFLNDYRLNIIAPAEIADADFDKFSTGLGFAMNVIKRQKDSADKIINQTAHRKVDVDTAIFLNNVAKLGLEFDEKEDFIDVCEAMDNRIKKEKIVAAIDMGRELGIPDDELFSKVAQKYDVKIDDINNILSELVCN